MTKTDDKHLAAKFLDALWAGGPDLAEDVLKVYEQRITHELRMFDRVLVAIFDDKSVAAKNSRDEAMSFPEIVTMLTVAVDPEGQEFFGLSPAERQTIAEGLKEILFSVLEKHSN
jgi:hypothetical protein